MVLEQWPFSSLTFDEFVWRPVRLSHLQHWSWEISVIRKMLKNAEMTLWRHEHEEFPQDLSSAHFVRYQAHALIVSSYFIGMVTLKWGKEPCRINVVVMMVYRVVERDLY